jgi:hypothetical protein
MTDVNDVCVGEAEACERSEHVYNEMLMTYV